MCIYSHICTHPKTIPVRDDTLSFSNLIVVYISVLGDNTYQSGCHQHQDQQQCCSSSIFEPTPRSSSPIVIVMYMFVVLSCAAPQVNWSLSPALAFLVGVPRRCPTSSLSSLLSSQYHSVVIVSYSDVLLYNVYCYCCNQFSGVSRPSCCLRCFSLFSSLDRCNQTPLRHANLILVIVIIIVSLSSLIRVLVCLRPSTIVNHGVVNKSAEEKKPMRRSF